MPGSAEGTHTEGVPDVPNQDHQSRRHAAAPTRTHVERLTAKPTSPDAHEHMVGMRDGVRLATDVYLPREDCQPGPTVLTRLPYDKAGDYCFMPLIARYFVDRGYRVVVQDVRGKFRSEGETLMFVNETYDGSDTLSWITDQPWSDGHVGMWGDSYFGFTQWAAAATSHPALRAMVPRLTGTDVGGLPKQRPGSNVTDVEMSVSRLYALTWFHDRDYVMWDFDPTVRPLAAEAERFFGLVGSRSSSYDLDFPYPSAVPRFPSGSPFDAPAVPVLMTIGWWDNCAPWQWADHRELQRHPTWQAREYLRLEAIDHENQSHFELGDLRSATESPEVLRRILEPAVEFFDAFLRGEGHDIPRVRWQLANSGDPTFRTSDAWPPADVVERQLYLALDAASPATGVLAHEPGPADEIAWVHDPNDLVPSPVNDAFAFLAEYPDESPRLQRSDVLKFTGDVLPDGLDLVGPVAFQAQVSSDGLEFDVFVRLLDLGADGAAHMIARGQVTVTGPPAAADVVIDMGHVGYRVHAGHRLVLAVAGSDFPEYVPSAGTGEHRWLSTRTVTTTQRLVLGGPGGAELRLSVQQAPSHATNSRGRSR